MSRIIFTVTLIAGMLMTSPVIAQRYDGLASYYGADFHGRRTANGGTFNMYEYTCAHRSLPFGTKIKVTNLSNKRSVIVTVTDRGPYRHGRVVDVSVAAAKHLGMLSRGVAPVSIDIMSRIDDRRYMAITQGKGPIKKPLEFMLKVRHLEEEFQFRLPTLTHGRQVS